MINAANKRFAYPMTGKSLCWIHATGLPSRSWSYAKFCFFKIDRKDAARTLFRWRKAIAGRCKWLPSATRLAKCVVVGDHLQWVQVDANFWEKCSTRWNRWIFPLIPFVAQALILITWPTFIIRRIVFIFTWWIDKRNTNELYCKMPLYTVWCEMDKRVVTYLTV